MIRLIFLVSAIFSFTVSAENKADCYETAMTQRELNRCAGSKNEEAGDLLNQLLVELKKILPERPVGHLIESQKAWELVVKNDCEIESWYLEGGSARPIVVAGCYAIHSEQRVKMLLPLLCHPMISTCEARVKFEKNL